MTREVDLVEEVARIHGYEQIPEDVAVPMAASTRTRQDRILEKIRGVLLAAGIDEALTPSAVDGQTSAAMSPWTTAEPLRSLIPVIRGADCLRRTLIPSLLGARRINEALSNPEIELFEIAKIYLPRQDDLPDEELMLGITSGRDLTFVKGVIEAIVEALRCKSALESMQRRNSTHRSGPILPIQTGRRTAGIYGQIIAGRTEAVRSARADHRGRDQNMAALSKPPT